MQMIAQTEKITLDGMVGPVEAVRNRPAGSAKGVAVVAHRPIAERTWRIRIESPELAAAATPGRSARAAATR